MSDPFVMLACPGHNRTLDIGAAIGLLAMPTRAVRCFPRAHKSSVLPQTFNALLAQALDLRDDPQNQVTHLAMIHTDIEPEPWWLDKLLAVMAETGADVVSAVVPIKDRHGLTSTGCIDAADPSRLVRRLTLREVHGSLPESFGAEDLEGLAGPNQLLMVNSGLMLLDLRRPWAYAVDEQNHLRVRFRFETRIERKRMPDGRWRHFANSESEDWLFSQDLAALGGKVVATRAVRLSHYDGGTAYANDDWGDWETDLAYQSIRRTGFFVPAAAEGPDFRFPADVPGWLTETEGRALARMARGKDVLEIGSWCGRSTVCLAQTARRVVAVDPHDSRATLPEAEDTWPRFLGSLGRYGVAERVEARRGTSAAVLPDLAADGERFDLAFIDGAHDYANVARDADLATAVLKPGGLLAFHDYRTRPGEHDGRWDPGVTLTVDELCERGGGLLGCWGTVALVRPPAPPVVRLN